MEKIYGLPLNEILKLKELIDLNGSDRVFKEIEDSLRAREERRERECVDFIINNTNSTAASARYMLREIKKILNRTW